MLRDLLGTIDSNRGIRGWSPSEMTAYKQGQDGHAGSDCYAFSTLAQVSSAPVAGRDSRYRVRRPDVSN